MVKFTLKGISNLTESPAYFQQVNGIYRKDGALAENNRNLMLHQLFAIDDKEALLQWFKEKSPQPSLIRTEDLDSIKREHCLEYYEESLATHCLGFLTTAGFKKNQLDEVKASLPTHLNQAGNTLLKKAIRAAGLMYLENLINTNNELASLLLVAGKENLQGLLSAVIPPAHANLTELLAPTDFHQLWQQHLTPLLNYQHIKETRKTVAALNQLSPGEVLKRTGVNLTQITTNSKPIAYLLKNYQIQLEAHLINMAFDELTILSEHDPEVDRITEYYDPVAQRLMDQPQEWHKLRNSLCFSIALIKALQQYENALGFSGNLAYGDYVFKKVSQHSIHELCKFIVTQEPLGLRADSFFIFLLDQKESLGLNEALQPLLSIGRLQTCFEKQLYCNVPQ